MKPGAKELVGRLRIRSDEFHALNYVPDNVSLAAATQIETLSAEVESLRARLDNMTEVKAAAWDEGFESCEEKGWLATNPYRRFLNGLDPEVTD